MDGQVRVLHVDDDPDFADLVVTYLERANDRLTVETATTPTDGFAKLGDTEIDCVVSDYDMPSQNGIEFLETVRAEYPELPFILFTGKGSETVASEAISAGVTDYLQKGSGTDQYTILANRIINAVERYRTETALERSEQRYRRLIEQAPAPVIIYANTGEIIDLNEAAQRFFGAETDTELLGTPATELIHPDHRAELTDRLRQLTEEDRPVPQMQQKIVALDGVIKHAIVSSRPIRYEGEVAIQTIALDITERVEQQAQLEHERDRFESLFETLPEPIAFFSGEDSLEATVSRVNNAFEDVFGYDEAVARDQHLNDLIVPDDRLQEAKQVDRENVGGGVISREVTRQTADGDHREFLLLTTKITEDETDGRIEGFAIYIDITDAKAREHRLKALHEATRELMEADSRQTIANITVETAREILGLPLNTLYLYDEDDDVLRPTAATTAVIDELGDPPVFASPETLAWEVYQTGEPDFFDDLSTEPRRYNPDTPVRALMLLPLGDHGVMIISSTEVGAFDETDVTMAQILAANTTVALTRADKE